MEARKRLRERASADPTERVLFANILEQRRIVKEAASNSQQRRRQERIPSQTSPLSHGQVTTEGAGKQSDHLEPFPVEIWQRE
jgi:hypothetical protein